jgi:hypothetical protein
MDAPDVGSKIKIIYLNFLERICPIKQFFENILLIDFIHRE